MKILSVSLAVLFMMCILLLSGCTDGGGDDTATGSAVTTAVETTGTDTAIEETTEPDYGAALSDFFENGYTGEPIELPDIPLS